MSVVSIGLEIHVALKTDRKVFSPEKTNELSWVSCGFIGTLPTINLEAVEKAMKLAGALNCVINHDRISFDRKNYFYHDLPGGYQITQYFNPLGKEGSVVLSNGRRIRVKQVHLEADTAQQFKHHNFISFNFLRLGRALAEVVTEPDFQSYEEVEEFLKLFRRICRFNGISNAAYEAGEMRVDLNISTRAREGDAMNPKSEVKNLNSLNAINKSIDYLVQMQGEALESGTPSQSFTYAWSEQLNACEIMRKKGGSADYFYVPEANIPVFSISKERYGELMEGLVLNFDSLAQSLRKGGLKEAEVEFLMENHDVFETVMRLNSKLNNLTSSYNWMVNVISGMAKNLE